jgi:rhodanese-related sulfurtransferase
MQRPTRSRFHLARTSLCLAAALCTGAVCLPLHRTVAAEATNKTKSSAGVHHVDAAGAKKLLDDKQVVVLDIRTPEEFEEGHIPGAKNIDFLGKDFQQQLAKLDKTKTYLLHCASGTRSSRSLSVFQKLNFASVYHLDGGMSAWEKAKQPVEK